MFYVIPAWYPKERPWYHEDPVWYRPSPNLAYDDSLHQLRLLVNAQRPCQLLVLNYFPQLRYFTHRSGLLEVERWSVFDEIQAVSGIGTRLLDFEDFDWPKDAEFIYTPFLILVKQGGSLFARVYFGQEGQLVYLERFEGNQIIQRQLFDDRGFLSSILYFEDGKESYQDYLNGFGEWQIREYLGKGATRVEVAPSQRHRFEQETYDSLADLIREKFQDFCQQHFKLGTYAFVSAHPQHDALCLSSKQDAQLILSYQQRRMEAYGTQLNFEVRVQPDLVIADRRQLVGEIEARWHQVVHYLPLFERRLSLGKSQRLKESYLYFILDNLSLEDLVDGLTAVLNLMLEEGDCHLYLVTYDDIKVKSEGKDRLIRDLLEAFGQEDFFLESGNELPFIDNPEHGGAESRITWLHLESEARIQEILMNSRLVIDLSEDPHPYTQMVALSVGLPQINRVESDYVEHLKNGYILKELDQLTDALTHYTNSLTNWNQALVHSVQKIEAFTSNNLLDRLLRDFKEND